MLRKEEYVLYLGYFRAIMGIGNCPDRFEFA